MFINGTMETAIYATGGGALIFYLIKHVLLSALKGKSEMTAINAQDAMTQRYLDEIKRLEGIIKKLNDRVNELEEKLEDLLNLEIQDAADIAELTVVVEGSCISQCERESGRIKSILNRLRTRRAEKATRVKRTKE